MHDLRRDSFTSGTVDIVLVGGPDGIPESERSRRGVITDRKIKIGHHGGYEHFELEEPSDERNGSTPAIFRWTMRTKIAE